ncbi:MAG: BPL-N domain-containing protein [Pirellulales bacterium]
MKSRQKTLIDPVKWYPRYSVSLALLGVLVSLAALAQEPAGLVQTQAGDLPIIISAPHGGKLDIPEVDARKIEGRPTGGRGYVVSRDSGTEELAFEVAAAIEKEFGKKPYFVIARSHRKYVDFNRPPEIAYDDPDTKPVYDSYHEALRQSCEAVQKRFHRGLLLDLHGQRTAKEKVFRGTHDGKTVQLLRERFGEGAHRGEDSLLARLKAGGWHVHPDPFDGKEQAGFRGGYIVQTYGSHQRFGIDAIQLEFGADYRASDRRQQTANTLCLAVAEYADDFLGIPRIRHDRAIEVAVYQGAGAGKSRAALMQVLGGETRLKVRDITPDEIRAGRLEGCHVLIQPGGSGSAQGKALGSEGREEVRAFVERGGGFIGLCAGAYLATCDYDWSLGILDAKVIDRKHWNRGFGTVDIGLSRQGRDFFHVDDERISIYYHQGPLLAPAENAKIADYDDLAKFETEIAANGAPMGVMPGCTAIAAGTFGQGRVLCFSPHPERTEGQGTMLLRGILWAAHAK